MTQQELIFRLRHEVLGDLCGLGYTVGESNKGVYIQSPYGFYYKPIVMTMVMRFVMSFPNIFNAVWLDDDRIYFDIIRFARY